MKVLVFIFFWTCIANQVHSQYDYRTHDIAYQLDTIFTWDRIDSWSSQTKKEYYTRKLYNVKFKEHWARNDYSGSRYSDDPGPSIEWFLRRHLENVHLVDLDEDMDMDLIYDGHSMGSESGIVDIFENVDGKLVRRLSKAGTLANINLKRKELVVHQYGCCGNPVQQLIRFKYSFDKELSFVQKKNNIYVTDSSEDYLGISIYPPEIFKSIPFTLDSISELRWVPDTSSREVNFGCSKSDTTNISAFYPVGSKGQVLYQSEDKQWVYVWMQNNIAVENRCVIFEIKGKHGTYGWFFTPKTSA